MHILIGAIIGALVSVGLTFVASKVIDKPLTWKDVAAAAAAGIIGGAVATATLGIGAATTIRTVSAFTAGGATGSAAGQVTDNVLHGHEVQEGLVTSTLVGAAIGAGTLGAGKLVAPIARRIPGLAAIANGGHGGGNSFAGAAAGLDDAIVPVARYVKNALGREEAAKENTQVQGGTKSAGALGALKSLNKTSPKTSQNSPGNKPRTRQTKASDKKNQSKKKKIIKRPLGLE
jgi:hypothetical protein